jgi:hypothetical protein
MYNTPELELVGAARTVVLGVEEFKLDETYGDDNEQKPYIDDAPESAW